MTGLALTSTCVDQRIALRGIRLTARLAGMSNKTQVEQTFVNQESCDIEVVYTFPLPEDAAVSRFEVLTDDRVLTGKVEDCDKAIDQYEEAITQGDLGVGEGDIIFASSRHPAAAEVLDVLRRGAALVVSGVGS